MYNVKMLLPEPSDPVSCSVMIVVGLRCHNTAFLSAR